MTRRRRPRTVSQGAAPTGPPIAMTEGRRDRVTRGRPLTARRKMATAAPRLPVTAAVKVD